MQYIHIGNHSVVHLKLIQCYIPTLSQLIKKTDRKYRRCENIINLTELHRSLSIIHVEDTVFSLQKSTINYAVLQSNSTNFKITACRSLSRPFYKVLIKRQPENLCMFGNWVTHLSNSWIKDGITQEIKKHFELSYKNTIYQVLKMQLKQ